MIGHSSPPMVTRYSDWPTFVKSVPYRKEEEGEGGGGRGGEGRGGEGIEVHADELKQFELYSSMHMYQSCLISTLSLTAYRYLNGTFGLFSVLLVEVGGEAWVGYDIELEVLNWYVWAGSIHHYDARGCSRGRARRCNTHHGGGIGDTAGSLEVHAITDHHSIYRSILVVQVSHGKGEGAPGIPPHQNLVSPHVLTSPVCLLLLPVSTRLGCCNTFRLHPLKVSRIPPL